MNCFQLSSLMASQGADRQHMAAVLEALHNESMLPAWGPGKTGAELSTREVVSVVLGSTAANPEQAATHVDTVSSLIRNDGLSFAEILTKFIGNCSDKITIEEISVSADGQSATIKHNAGPVEVFYANGELKPFRVGTTIRGCLLAQIKVKMECPTRSGWIGDE